MEIVSIQKNVRSTPRKLRLVADMVRNQAPNQALISLNFADKAAAIPLSKAIKTALANAKQSNIDSEKLAFKKLEINEGLKMKRARASGRGFISGYKRRTSHIRIVLTDELKVENNKLKTKKQNKKTEISTKEEK